MKTRHLALMATVAIAALGVSLTTTAVQAKAPGLGAALATSTFSQDQAGQTLKATALQATQGQTQLGKTIGHTETIMVVAKAFTKKWATAKMSSDGGTVLSPSAVGNLQANDLAGTRRQHASSFTNPATAHVRQVRAGTFQYKANSRAM